MPTPSERRALLFVAAVAALGFALRGLRALRQDAAPADAREALASQIAAVDSAVASGGRTRNRRIPETPKAEWRRSSAATAVSSRAPSTSSADPAPRTVDLDRANETELDALPGIGPALARRIVENRYSHGPFGSLDALQEVRGIGPALAAKLAPFVTFSAPPRAPRSSSERSRSSHP